MNDPYFWAERKADSSPRPFSDFTAASTDSDPNNPPLELSGLEPGQYDVYVSKGENGTKRGPTALTWRNPVAYNFSADRAWDVAFWADTPVLEAIRQSDSTLQDFAASEVDGGPLESFSNGGEVGLRRLYDQTGGGNHLTAPSGDEPPIVTSGSLVTGGSGNPTIDLSNGGTLSGSAPTPTGGLVALTANPSDTDQTFCTANGVKINTTASNVSVKLTSTGTWTSRWRHLTNIANGASVDDLTYQNGYVWYDNFDDEISRIDSNGNIDTYFSGNSDSSRGMIRLGGDIIWKKGVSDWRLWDGSSWSQVYTNIGPQTLENRFTSASDTTYYGVQATNGQLFKVVNDNGGFSIQKIHEFGREGQDSVTTGGGKIFVWHSYSGTYFSVYDLENSTELYNSTISNLSNPVIFYAFDECWAEDGTDVYRWTGSGFTKEYTGIGEFSNEVRIEFKGNFYTRNDSELDQLLRWDGTSNSADVVLDGQAGDTAINEFVHGVPSEKGLLVGGNNGSPDYDAQVDRLPVGTKTASVSRPSGSGGFVAGYTSDKLICRVNDTESVTSHNLTIPDTGTFEVGGAGTLQRAAFFSGVQTPNERQQMARSLNT
jgi:hypothetical protein